MKAFLAIELTDKAKSDIEATLYDFKLKEYPQLDWKNKNNYLINVFEFGEVSDINRLKTRISDLLYDQEVFHLYSMYCDVLIKHKIYLYVNFRREKKLEALYQKLANNFKDMSGGSDYEPVINFAKGKVPSKQQYFVLKKKLEKINIDIEVNVNKISLFGIETVEGTTVVKKVSSIKLINL